MRKFGILLIGLFSCNLLENKPVGTADISQVEAFLIKEFDVPKYQHQDVRDAVAYGVSPDKEIILLPSHIKLQLIRVSQPYNYSPFVIKVSDADNNLTYLFTFTDELFYMNNNVSAEFYNNKIIKREPVQALEKVSHKRNMEDNLNALIRKLGFENDEHQINQLLEVIFNDLLKMRSVTNYELDVLNSRFSKVVAKDSLSRATVREYAALQEDLWRGLFCVASNEGGLGFWVFTLRRDQKSFAIKTKFVGDLLFFNIYM